jgi:hypothetical protein
MNIRPSSHKIPAQARKRGNPNWGQPQTAQLAAMPTEFELHAKSLRLTEKQYASSNELRVWCKQNKNRCFVPEWLLTEWGMLVEISF